MSRDRHLWPNTLRDILLRTKQRGGPSLLGPTSREVIDSITTTTSGNDPDDLGLVAGAVKDFHIDWGTGSNQVNADDIPDGSVHGIPTLVQIADWATHVLETDIHVDHSTIMVSAGDGLAGGGTIDADIALAVDMLGLEDLTDPNADRIVFWDDTAGGSNWLICEDSLEIVDTTLHLVGDVEIPTADQYYGTDSTGSRGWFDLPSGAPGGAHHLTHEDGGSDEISVAGLSGVLAEAQTPAAHNQAYTTINTVPSGTVLGRVTAGVGAAEALTDLPAVTMTSKYIYRADGTDVPIADGGTGASDAATAFTNLKQAATEAASGVVELATIAEVNAGTDAGRVICPDQLAGSVFGRKIYNIKVIDDTTILTIGDGKIYFTIPASLSGFNLVDADASVSTVSSSGLPTIQIHNATDAQDMLSTRITIDASEYTSYTAVTQPVINAAYDDVVTGDRLRIDVDVSGTGAKGLEIMLEFAKP